MNRGLVDLPAGRDALGCEPYFEGLAKFIETCSTPMTIAIQGDWGSGKSSCMEIVKSKLDTKKTYSANFNTWQYAKTAQKMLFVPLLLQLENAMNEAAKDNAEYQKEYGEDQKKWVRNAIVNIAKSFLVGIGTSNEIVDQIYGYYSEGKKSANKKASAKVDEENRNLSDHFKLMLELHEDFKKRINLICKDGEYRFVFFVDDLDRLNPEAAVELLEDIKNFMECEHCVFVLALDHTIVRRGLRKKYGADIDDLYADRFFDKIIQVPFSLPTHQYDIQQYIGELCKDSEAFTPEIIASMTRTIETFGDTNPRTIKRALNILQLYLSLGDEGRKKEAAEMFALLLLQMNHKVLYTELIDVLKTDAEKYEGGDDARLYFEAPGQELRIEHWLNKQQEKPAGQQILYIAELFGRDYIKLYRSVMDIAASYQGESVVIKRQKSMETKEHIRRYLKHLGFTEEKGNSSDGIYFNKENGIGAAIRLPDKDKTHVNLNLSYKAVFGKNVKITPKQMREILTDERIGIEESALITDGAGDAKNGVGDAKNGAGSAKTREGAGDPANVDALQVLCNTENVCCLYRIDAEDRKTCLAVGKILRAIKKGTLSEVMKEKI